MDDINTGYLGRHKKFRADSKKLAIGFFFAAFIVAVIVFWWLKLTGITVTGEALCGLSEHSHGDGCYVSELICGFGEVSTEDDGDTTDPTHIHTDECYNKIFSCSIPEHLHSTECFPDKTADLETVSDWLRDIEKLEITNNIPENLITVALSQMGYEESRLNFEYDAEGNKNGYTRYGEWYGNPYGRWNTMFTSFCLHYSNIYNCSALKAAGAEAMKIAWAKNDLYAPYNSHTPARGEIAFIDTNGDGAADITGIILSADENGLLIVLGDSNNTVETKALSYSDEILGYGLTGELHFAANTLKAEKPSDTEDESPQDYTPLLMAEEETDEENAPEIEEITDLTKAIVDISFHTQDNTEITDGATVYIGQTYVISMEFAEVNTGSHWIQFHHGADHYLTYQIPENIHCEPFDEWHHIYARLEDGTVNEVGIYHIDENGFLRVRFIDDPETGLCFGQTYSNVAFRIEFNASVGTTQSGSSTDIIFNDKIHVQLQIDGGAGVTVDKSYGEYDADAHTMDYTIKVEATHGVVHDLVLDDYIWNTHDALTDTILVTDLEGNPIDPQPTVLKPEARGFQLTGFPDFSAGEGFLVTYKSKLDDAAVTGNSAAFNNGTYAQGTDSKGDTVQSNYDEVYTVVELEKITKDGKQIIVKDAANNDVTLIEWEVAIRKNNTNLQGTVIIDTLGEGLQYYTEKPIQIKHYDEWGNPLTDTYISWDEVTVNGNSMEFRLPEGYTFDIFYYTSFVIPDEGEIRNYTNQVSATINGKHESTGGSADVVGFTPRVSKAASGNDGEYVYFTIEADVPAVIKGWGHFYLTDFSAFYWADSSLFVENMPLEMVITATTADGDTVVFTPYEEGGPAVNTYILEAPAAGNQHHSFAVYFNTPLAEKSLSQWLLDEDSVLTITYKLPFSAKTGTEWTGELTGEKTLKDLLFEENSLSNQVYFNYTDVIKQEASAIYNYSPKLAKESSVRDGGVIDYTVTFNNTITGGEAISGYLNRSTQSAYFTDTFDPRLEYVEGSLTVTCYTFYNQSEWLCKYAYDGKIEGNTINLHARDFKLIGTNSWGSTMLTTLEQYYKIMDEWQSPGGIFVFDYSLKVKDEYLYSTDYAVYFLDNTAEITWDTDGSSGKASDRIQFKTGIADKQVTQRNDKLDFAIHINRYALDILPGLDTLIIDDTMTPNLSIYWDSIKLYYEDSNKEWISFDDEQSAYTYSVTYDPITNKLTFAVPDSLHILIDYTTLITESGLVSINNSVKIDGKAQVSDIIDAIFKVEKHSSGATGSIHNITLLKQDGDTDAPLPDVTFRLYGPMGDPEAVITDGAPRSIKTERGESLYYIGRYTTGADGTVNIETQYLTTGGPYALVEVNPPEGYKAPDAPTYFYFYANDPNDSIQTVTTLIAIENLMYNFVLPETGGAGTIPTAIIGVSLMTFPILYSILRRKRERRQENLSP